MNEQNIALALAALDLATKAIPILQGLQLAGTVTVEAQQKVKDAYQALRDAGDAAFSGSQWQIEPAGPGPDPVGSDGIAGTTGEPAAPTPMQ